MIGMYRCMGNFLLPIACCILPMNLETLAWCIYLNSKALSMTQVLFTKMLPMRATVVGICPCLTPAHPFPNEIQPVAGHDYKASPIRAVGIAVPVANAEHLKLCKAMACAIAAAMGAGAGDIFEATLFAPTVSALTYCVFLFILF